jgi:Transcriptional regulator
LKEKILDKRAAALRAALELISGQGFHGTPMSQIAKKANVSIGAIYHYFTGKDELINALYIDVKTRLAEHMLRNYSGDLPVRKAFKLLFGAIVKYVIENPSEFYFVEQYENSPLITASTREEVKSIGKPISDLFQRAMEQDLLKELPFEMLNALIGSAVTGLARLYLSGAVKLEEETLAAGLDAIWDMIKR